MMIYLSYVQKRNWALGRFEKLMMIYVCVCVCVYIYNIYIYISRFTGRFCLTNWWMDPYFTDDLNPLLLKYGGKLII